MSPNERLEDQLRRAFEGGAWHGPSVLETLQGVSAAMAHEHPVAGAHSIWEIVRHLEGTYDLVLRRLAGDAAPLAPEEDWPEIPEPDPAAWDAAEAALRARNEELRRAVRAFPLERMDLPLVADVPYAAYTQFIGITQHDLYHAGQIMVLKRALAGR